MPMQGITNLRSASGGLTPEEHDWLESLYSDRIYTKGVKEGILLTTGSSNGYIFVTNNDTITPQLITFSTSPYETTNIYLEKFNGTGGTQYNFRAKAKTAGLYYYQYFGRGADQGLQTFGSGTEYFNVDDVICSINTYGTAAWNKTFYILVNYIGEDSSE